MRNLLLTGVAMAALLLTPLAVRAQPDTAADPYGYSSSSSSTASPSSASSATADPAATEPKTPSTATNATATYDASPNATAAQADAHATTHGATADAATTATPSTATADATTATEADTTQSADATTAEQPDAYAAQNPDAATAAAAPQQAYAQNAAATENLISDQAALELAQEAGLAAVPMSAADVCAARTVALDGTSDLSPTNQVEAAVDRASVCRLQHVTIQAPRARAASLQRTIEARGVDASLITVEHVAASESAVRMDFRGLATSSPSYAALYNPQYAANTQGYAQPQTQSDAGSGYAPSATPDANMSPAPATPADPYATTPDTAAPETAPEAAPSSTAPSETF